MNSFPLVISYYTQDTLYQVEAQNLIASCEKWGLDHSINPIPSTGSWELNCAYKPYFILKKLGEFQRPVLWVDADAVFEKAPAPIPAFDADIAAYIEPNVADSHRSKVRSGTLYVNTTPAARTVIQKWAAECRAQLLSRDRKQEFWDQVALRDVLLKSAATVACLPLSYIKIFDHPADAAAESIIVHYQASRRLKNLV